MFISKELLTAGCERIGLTLDGEAIDRFDAYARLLVDYNEKVNLTAITAPDEIVNKHFVDSLFLAKFVTLQDGTRLCDVGTGAGFPGAALLTAFPKLRVTLFDSVNKKLDFIRGLVMELGLEAEIVTVRAEEAGRTPAYRERFDVATARAVAQLNVLSEFCVPLVKQGGVFAPMKAPLSEEERRRGVSAAANLGAKLEQDETYAIPDGSEREVLVFRKKSATAGKYPRPFSQISKKPL